MTAKKAIIIGAGPAGLTAAYELLTRTEIKPIIFEASSEIGGISRTVCYKGNRLDIGGHRFFSRSQRVNEFWENFLRDKLMLVRKRKSSILFMRKLFSYPITLSYPTLKKLGIARVFKIIISYLTTII